ncbi:nucleolar protein 16 [Paramormyrops kingsleyae]|uniref:Nucleolar protein 16 n=1 Tax=Paramormyrops kingsleyae TaxID=1676925 RepID=A0A3B3SA20_9TELE|nr:nucleolar protein 16 [Paramormyrops kingsleyae]
MPKAKKAGRKKKFDYNKDRKKLKRKVKKKMAPRIACSQMRNAWNEHSTVAKNLSDMGLAFDPNVAVPLRKNKASGMDVDEVAQIVRKPYVIKEMEAQAKLPKQDTRTVSTDMIEYVQHMIREHKEDYKAMARDEKNYYQDTPKQIKRKIELYKQCHPEEYAAFLELLKTEQMDTK